MQIGNYDEHAQRAVPKPDPEQIKRFAEMLRPNATGCWELRAIGKKDSQEWCDRRNDVGFFDNVEQLVASVLKYHGKRQVFIGLNPRPLELLHAVPANKMHESAEGAKDHEIKNYHWLPLDIDTVRPNQRVAATKDELQMALPVYKAITAELESRGIKPVEGMSGNGRHLLIPTIDYSATKENTGKLHALLKWFSRKFDTDKANIDTSVHNPSRVWKVYGSAAVKGANTTERPYRIAKFRLPDDGVSKYDVFSIFADEIAEQQQQEMSSAVKDFHRRGTPADALRDYKGSMATLDIVQLFKTQELYVKTLGGGKHAVTCPWVDEHSTDTTGTSSTIIYEGNGKKWPTYDCKHSHCSDRKIQEVIDFFGSETIDRFCQEQFSTDRKHEESRVSTKSLRHKKRSWPEPMSSEAFDGLFGKVVSTIAPHTEADPVAILVQLLVVFGNVIGRQPHYFVEANRHFLNEFIILVGETSKGRKGTALAHVRRVIDKAAQEWSQTCVSSAGLSSGEGLIYAVRDPIETEVVGKDGVGRQKVLDSGVTDKRLLVEETEFSAVFQKLRREGNTLSATLRNAWDSKDLRIMTKQSPYRATAPHISVIGHITRHELLRNISENDAVNGFGNRFLWVCVKRSNLLPNGGALEDGDLENLVQGLREAIAYARDIDRIQFAADANRLWCHIYPHLSREIHGMLGAMTARAEPQVLRLSCLYALADHSSIISSEHLLSALAVWDYVERSCEYLFGDSFGDPIADAIMRAFQSCRAGMTRTEIRDLFGRNKDAFEIEAALGMLCQNGLIQQIPEANGSRGRPAERWLLCANETTKLDGSEQTQANSSFSSCGQRRISCVSIAKAFISSTDLGTESRLKSESVVSQAAQVVNELRESGVQQTKVAPELDEDCAVIDFSEYGSIADFEVADEEENASISWDDPVGAEGRCDG